MFRLFTLACAADSLSHLQTVKALQLKQSRLEAQQRELEQENGELKAEKRANAKRKDKSKALKKAQRKATTATTAPRHGAGAPNDPARRDSESGDEEDEEGPDALQVGKMFFVRGEPWIVPDISDLFRTPKPRFAYNNPSCYDETTPGALLIGAAADLYHIVPRKLQEKISSPAEFQ